MCRMARENAWGYERLRGELLKLGSVLSKGCISAILHRNGIAPAPQRRELSWRQFLDRHAERIGRSPRASSYTIGTRSSPGTSTRF